MDSITINEIKEAACGVDEEGTPKSIVICGLQRFNVNDTTEDPQSLMESSTIEAEVEIEEVVVYDVFGRHQLTETPSRQGNLVVDVANLNSGVYFVKIVTSEGEIVKRFVKS